MEMGVVPFIALVMALAQGAILFAIVYFGARLAVRHEWRLRMDEERR